MRWGKVRWGDSHWLPKKDYTAFRRTLPPLTEEEIVDRAARKAQNWAYLCRFFAAVAVVILVGITEPVHGWIRRHIEFMFGVTLGSWLELAVCERWPQRCFAWLRDRWLWLRWFSWQ